MSWLTDRAVALAVPVMLGAVAGFLIDARLLDAAVCRAVDQAIGEPRPSDSLLKLPHLVR